MAKKQRTSATLDEADAFWRATGTRAEFERELAERGFKSQYGVFDLAEAYVQAGRFDELAALARTLIDSRNENDAFWSGQLVIALCELGRISDAEPVMRSLVNALDDTEADNMVAVMRYHRALGETATEALLFHAGSKWVTGFKRTMAKRGDGSYGTAPADLVQQFLAWLDRWTGMMTRDVATTPSFNMWRWLHALPAKATAQRRAQIEAEEARRTALLAKLAAAPDEATARGLVEQVAWFVTPRLAVGYEMKPMRGRLPLATFALMKHAHHNAGLTDEGSDGEQAFLVSLALSIPALAGELADIYQLARVVPTANHEHHIDLARAALRLGKHEAAIEHVMRALHYQGRYYGVASPKATGAANKLQAHPELAPLRDNPAFERVFADDAAVRKAAKRQ